MVHRLAHPLEVLAGGRTACDNRWRSPVRRRGARVQIYRLHGPGAQIVDEDGHRIGLRSDRLYVLSGMRPSGYTCTRPFTIDWLHLAARDGVFALQLATLPLLSSVARTEVPTIDATLARCCPVGPDAWSAADGLALHAALLGLIGTVLAGRQPAGADPRLSIVLDWLRQHDHRPLEVAVLAARVGWSVPHLRRRFRELMGQSLQQHHEDLRLQRAQRLLLSSDDAIAEVAAACGWDDPRYFARVFKRATGMTPRSWRRDAVVP